MTELKQCPNCGTVFNDGRSDKKFCCKQCRCSYARRVCERKKRAREKEEKARRIENFKERLKKWKIESI